MKCKICGKEMGFDEWVWVWSDAKKTFVKGCEECDRKITEERIKKGGVK